MYALLTIYQRKTLPHLHQEWNQVINDGLLQFTLCIIRPVLESQELSHHRILQMLQAVLQGRRCLTLLRPVAVTL